MANYPKQLPLPSRQGFGSQLPQKRARFEMDNGQFRDSRKWITQPRRFTLTWELTTYEQAAIFEAWFEYTLNQAVEYVDIPLAGDFIHCRATTGAPTYTPNGAGWVASASFDTLSAKPPAFAGNAQWPLELPEFEKAEFTIVPTQGPARSDIETGLPEVRSRFRSRLTTYGGKMLMTLEQRNRFWSFHDNELLSGLAWFRAPFANSVFNGKLRARITGTPIESAEGHCFWIKFTLETISAPMLSVTDYNDLVSEFVNDYCEEDYVESGYTGQYIIGV